MPAVSHISLLTPLLADTPDLSVLQNPAAWNAIKQNAGRYGVAALIAYTVRPHVSRDDRPWCDRILTESWIRHERMLRELDYVLSLLSSEGIPAVSLKGPLLARRLFEPPFLRKPSMDLDVAVRQPDLEAACQALLRAGYTLDLPLSEAVALSHHVTFSHPSRTHLELHFRLSHHTLGIPVEEFFERTECVRLPSGLEARVLAHADQLLHLVLHLAQSRFGTLFHLYEIRRAFSAAPPEVRSEAIQRVVAHRFCGALRMADVAVRTCLGNGFLSANPSIPKTWLNWRLDEKLYRDFERWGVPDRELTLAARLWGRWLEFQLTDSPSDALRFVKLFARTARSRIAQGAWGKIRNLTYTPHHIAR